MRAKSEVDNTVTTNAEIRSRKLLPFPDAEFDLIRYGPMQIRRCSMKKSCPILPFLFIPDNKVARQEGAALVQMLEDSLSQVNEHLLDTYA